MTDNATVASTANDTAGSSTSDFKLSLVHGDLTFHICVSNSGPGRAIAIETVPSAVLLERTPVGSVIMPPSDSLRPVPPVQRVSADSLTPELSSGPSIAPSSQSSPSKTVPSVPSPRRSDGHGDGWRDAILEARRQSEGTFEDKEEQDQAEEEEEVENADVTLIDGKEGSPPSYIPVPNTRTGCKLTPRTRKRIGRVLPPSHVMQKAVKRFKESLQDGE
ncbi:hypothetical protein OH77DRAFT_1515582 [Trametes cingulata]|nr:hypothetical protein OH77DRAFT_1515582 [Trametes cingulata]